MRHLLSVTVLRAKAFKKKVEEMEKGRDGEVKDKRDYRDSLLLPERK